MSFAFCFGLSVAAFAQPDQKEMKKMEKEKQEMTQLVEKYNKATSDKKKEEIRAKIAAKVAANYDKHIERMEERIQDSQKKLDEAKVKLAESRTPEFKAKHVDEITQNIISGEMKPMFGMPPTFKGNHQKGMQWDKKGDKECPFAKAAKEGKGCPCMKGEGKDGKECPFAKAAKEGKGCPCMKGEGKDGKECPFAKAAKEGKGCPCMKGHKHGLKGPKLGKEPADEMPVIKEVPQEK